MHLYDVYGYCIVMLCCCRAGSITSAAKSLDILRANLQKHINKEMDVIIQKYLEVSTEKGNLGLINTITGSSI